jgi:hypothetical protein
VSRIRIQQQQKKRGKQIYLSYLFCSHKFNKILNSLILNWYRKNVSQLTKNGSTFYPKNCH